MRKQIVGMIQLYVLGVFLAFALIVGAFALPTRNMQQNMKESAHTLLDEGVYPTFLDDILVRMRPGNVLDLKTLLFNNRITARDNFTDALMLAQASYDGTEPLLERAMAVYRWSTEDENPFGFLQSIINGNDTQIVRKQYDRYWHGYLVVLKPLLLIFDLSQIRIINLVVLTLLLGYCVLLMYQKIAKNYCGWFLYALLFFMPFTIPFCMQYCTATYVLLIALIILFKHYEWLQQESRLAYFFMIVGMTVAYVDYLTFPLVTFGIPVIFVLLSDPKKRTFKVDLLRVFRYGIDWSIGYVGLWASKWILASLIMHQNLIKESLQQVAFRASSTSEMGDFKITFFQAIGSNVCNYVNLVYIIVILVGLISVCRKIRPKQYSLPEVLKQYGIYLLIAMTPFVWYGVFKNHSYGHGSFTFRCLFITVFAGMVFLEKWKEQCRSRD